VTLKHEIAQDQDEVCAWAHNAHYRIVEYDNGLPCFARSSQNIATTMALLRGLLEPALLEGRQA
jgi:hypothetical protein